VAGRPFTGYYINLERSRERRARIEGQLARFLPDLRYQRFAAIDGATLARGSLSAGAAGCFRSHLALLEAAGEPATDLHILEDDASFSAGTGPAILRLAASNVLETFDLVFTDIFVPLELPEAAFYYRLYASSASQGARDPAQMPIHLIDLKHRPWGCTTSYFVARHAVRRLAALLREAFDAGPRQPVDLVLRELVNAGRLRAAVLFPFITSLNLETASESTIHAEADIDAARSRLACGLLRHLFSVAPDEALVRRLIEEHFSPPPGSQAQALAALLGYAVYGGFRAY
jgi:GR25 family glycosyltransferase involved in LPS biosynthesis